MSVIGTSKAEVLESVDRQTSYWSKFTLTIWPFQLIKKKNTRQKTAEMLNKAALYSSQFKWREEMEYTPEKWQRKSMRADVLGTCLPPKCDIYIFTQRKINVGNRTDWDGLRWYFVLRRARVAVSNCCMLKGPWCSVTYGRWPKGVKIALDSPVTKQHVIFDVLLLTDLHPQNFIAGARSSSPYPEVRNLCCLYGKPEIQKWDEDEPMCR